METKIYIKDLNELHNPDMFSELYNRLPRFRKEKIDRIIPENDKVRSLGAGMLLHELCDELGIVGADEHIVIGENGKPSFRDYPDIHFNLSHSGERAMLVASSLECGCDVEMIKPISLNVSKRSFTKKEHEYVIAADSDEEQRMRFFRLWTFKESVMKATGMGFKLFPDTFYIDLSKEKPTINVGNFPGLFSLYEEIRNDGYAYSYCTIY